MILALLLGCLLVALTFGIHYEVLQSLWAVLPRMTIPPRLRLLAVVLFAFLAHAAEITLYAAAFYFLKDKFQLGSFSGAFTDSFPSFVYFSAESFTSLGMGDIFPAGPLRLITGIESLNGLILVAWTASFTYMAMEKYWRPDGPSC
jgi:hypothetical protein